MDRHHFRLLDAQVDLEILERQILQFDAEDRTILWNRAFLRFFPEHAGHVHGFFYRHAPFGKSQKLLGECLRPF